MLNKMNLKKVLLKKKKSKITLYLDVLRASQGAEDCCNGDKNCCSQGAC